jgi:integrase
VGTKRKGIYRNGDITLGRSGEYWVADFHHVTRRKRKRLVTLDRPEAEARAALDRFAEARRAIIVQQASYTIGDLWAMWLADRKQDGLRNDIYQANWVSLRTAFANRDPALLKADDCRDYARSRFAAGKSPSTVHTELSRLRYCLKWAAENDLIAKRPIVWVPQPGRPRDMVLTPEEGFRLVKAGLDGDPHIGLFIILAFSTGGRHTAILDLTWDRVNFDAGTIELDENLRPDPMSKSWRKGRATVWMSDTARKALARAYAGRQSKHVIEHGGRRLKTVREGFANAVKRAGLPAGITPHTIRHTVASWTYGKVATGLTAQLLGHRDERTTRTVYQHPGAEATRPAVEVIDATFAALPEKPESRRGQGAKRGKKRKPLSISDDSEREAY